VKHQRVRHPVRWFCPVHPEEPAECTSACDTTRQEFQRTSQALRVYWHGRMKLGQRPMSTFRYRMEVARYAWA